MPTCTTEGSKSVKCLACGASDTTTVEPIEALGHTWDTKYTVDKAVTCLSDGQESIKCTVCTAIDPDSVRVIKSAGQHVLEDGYTVAVVPTVFAEGLAIGTCSVCHEEDVEAALDKTEMTLHTYTYTGNKTAEPHFGAANIGDALGDKTFKPGNDLFLEFSVLLNNTTDILNGEAFGLGHIFKDANLTQKVKEFAWFHYRPQWKWCPFKGGFDFSEVKSIPFGPQYQKGTEGDENPNSEYYVVLENYEGWHRFGLQYTQNFYQDASGNVTKHDVTVSVYLDGVLVTEAIMEWSDMFYTAALVDGTLTYTQNPNIASYYAVYYNIASGYIKNEGDPDAYFPFGDFSLTVGDSFAMPVAPVENPESATFTPALGAAPMDATVHFELRYMDDCLAGNHTYTGKFTVDYDATCVEDGQKSYKCEVCGNVKTEAIDALGHDWEDDYTIDIKPTCTTEGQKSKHCSVCDAKDSTEVIDALGHNWSAETTVDIKVTCTTNGQESKKCTVCGEINRDSIVIIEAAGQHVLEEGYTVTTLPTVFAEGVGIGTCSVCHEEDVEAALDKTEMTLHTYTYTGNKTAEPHFGAANIGDALGDKTFKPGNDLFLEFSVLLNNTTDILNGEAFGLGHIFKDANLTQKVKEFAWFHYRPQWKWCPFKGGFDFSEVKSIPFGPQYQKGTEGDENPNSEYYVVLENYEGWHRFGLQYTQNFYQDASGNVTKHDVTVSVYLDGVLVTEAIMEWSDMFYTAALVDGTLTYTQNPNIASYYAVYYNIASGYIKNEGDPDAYFPFGDFSLTVGDSFAMPVAPVENPESATFTPALGAAPMDATVHFELRYMDDCLAGNHTYTGKFTVDYDATCVEDGQKSYKCEVCGNVKTEVIESAGQHVWVDEGAVVTTVPTVFSEGVEASTCSVCGDPVTRSISMTPAITNKYTSNKTQKKYATANIGEVLGDKTFQPGNDLYLEFSVLLNDSTENVSGNGFGWGHIANNGTDLADKNLDKVFSWFYYRVDATWCPFKGGFEFSGAVKDWYNETYGPKYVKEGNKDDYVVIDNYNGWHRFGLQYTQNFYQDANGNVTGHDVTITVYVDGNVVHKMKMDWGAYFYEAKLVNGELVYTPNTNINDYYVVIYNIASGALIDASKPGYFPFADISVSVGDDWVMPVEPVETPTECVFDQDGININTTAHFKVKSN